MYKALNAGMIGIRLDLLDEIALAGKTGYGGITLDPERIMEVGEEKVLDQLLRHGVRNAGFGFEVDLTKEGAEWEKELSKLHRRALAARRTGATRCNHWILSSADLPYEAEFERLVKKIRPCAKLLENEGMTLALEFVGTKEVYDKGPYPFIRTMPEMLRLCASMDAKGCGLLLDSYHLFTAGHSVDDILKLTADQVAFVHINDALPGIPVDDLPDQNRLLPGESGVIDCKGFIRNLFAIGYEGPVVTEPFYAPFKDVADPEAKARRLMDALNSIWVADPN